MKRDITKSIKATKNPKKAIRLLDAKELASVTGGKGITMTDVIVS
jgi:bacteriocin-like protein